MNLEEFLSESRAAEPGGERFQRESDNVLRVDVEGGVWIKPGAAVGYRGNIRFERQRTIAADSVSNAALRELMPLVRATGTGRLYCANHGWTVHVVRLTGETVFVAWQELLAFEASLRFHETFVADGLTALGELRILRLSGTGSFALAVHGQPLTLSVTPGNPVITDPRATLAWTGDVQPSLKTDVEWRSLLGHGGQEPFQMLFEGTGHVVVQPHEHASSVRANAGKLMKELLAV
jgi:uncharacterized protein (AIM24 family)